MKINSLKLLEKLSNASGVSGFEDDVVEIIKSDFEKTFNIKEDKMRNLILYRKNHSGNKPVVMLDGHSDEVGFIVKSINPNGTIKFLPLGGWMPQSVSAQKVKIKNSKGEYVVGVVATKPPHFTKAPVSLETIDNMCIDVGATSAKEVIEIFEIEVGAPIIPLATFSYNEKTEVMLGKAFDNRLGCGAVIETLLALEDLDLEVDVVGAISVQEEVGCRGAKVNANHIKPDIAIIFEGSPADDTFMPPYESQGALKKGTQIRHFDVRFIANHRLISMSKSVANGRGIKFQCAVRSGGGTDAGPIHIENKATPCLVLGIPTRYAHTHYGFAALEDYYSTISLSVELIKKLNNEEIEKL